MKAPKGCKIKGKTFVKCPRDAVGSFTVPDGVTKIAGGAFSWCGSLTSVRMPDSVKEIGDHAFANCSALTSVDIPPSVRTIGDWAFDGCHSLTFVNIPESVTDIGAWAFGVCRNLREAVVSESCRVGFGGFPERIAITHEEYRKRAAAMIAAERSGDTVEAVGMHLPVMYDYADASSITKIINP